MRLPSAAHISQPWRIHDIASDFRLEDVWALPARGAREDFPQLVEWFTRASERENPSFLTRTLFAIRWMLGELMGWDDAESGVGSRVRALRERLPADLREGPRGPDFAALPFRSLYMLENEFAAETANSTMHGLLHLGWVPEGSGGYRGQMAVLVKPNGAFGNAYMTAIRPFRHLIVYPALMRQIEHAWRKRAAATAASR